MHAVKAMCDLACVTSVTYSAYRHCLFEHFPIHKFHSLKEIAGKFKARCTSYILLVIGLQAAVAFIIQKRIGI